MSGRFCCGEVERFWLPCAAMRWVILFAAAALLRDLQCPRLFNARHLLSALAISFIHGASAAAVPLALLRTRWASVLSLPALGLMPTEECLFLHACMHAHAFILVQTCSFDPLTVMVG